MLSREDNQLLTRVDAESPGGQLLRRYWQPVAAATELTDEKPIKKVKVLGEDLVVYRDKKGHYPLDQVLVQDAMAWETQGPVMDRSREHLGAGDKGVVIFRKLLREQIDIVQRGGTPLGCLLEDQGRPLIELDVINERIGVVTRQRVA